MDDEVHGLISEGVSEGPPTGVAHMLCGTNDLPGGSPSQLVAKA